jgi:hypothetical protein
VSYIYVKGLTIVGSFPMLLNDLALNDLDTP